LDIPPFVLLGLTFNLLLDHPSSLASMLLSHRDHATSFTEEKPESYHCIGHAILLSVRVRHRGVNSQSLSCPWFPINSSFETAHNATV
jgi:hypothetical protein